MEKFLIASTITLWVVVLFNLFLSLALVRRFGRFTVMPTLDNISTLGIGTQAPDFTAETLDGQLVSSATYSRESVLFVFVSPTCDPCIEKIGMFNKLYFQAKQHGVNIILVCLASKGETQVFADKYSIEVPMLVAPPENNSFMKSYKAPGTPFYCFVSNEGKVQSTGLLDSNWDQLVQKWGADD